ncbi:MAG TPA: hypothetical protein VIY86_12660, partial [Pirellulaceae bacterium]
KQLGFELERRFPRHFVPRYGLVMFHRIAYAEAQRRGVIQESILDALVPKSRKLDDVNWDLAQELIPAKLTELSSQVAGSAEKAP